MRLVVMVAGGVVAVVLAAVLAVVVVDGRSVPAAVDQSSQPPQQPQGPTLAPSCSVVEARTR
jgi:hypothetical protein